MVMFGKASECRQKCLFANDEGLSEAIVTEAKLVCDDGVNV